MAQKLDCVMSAIFWRIVLLQHKHISNNAADHSGSSSCISNTSHYRDTSCWF